jgi:hypothetical protein
MQMPPKKTKVKDRVPFQNKNVSGTSLANPFGDKLAIGKEGHECFLNGAGMPFVTENGLATHVLVVVEKGKGDEKIPEAKSPAGSVNGVRDEPSTANPDAVSIIGNNFNEKEVPLALEGNETVSVSLAETAAHTETAEETGLPKEILKMDCVMRRGEMKESVVERDGTPKSPPSLSLTFKVLVEMEALKKYLLDNDVPQIHRQNMMAFQGGEGKFWVIMCPKDMVKELTTKRGESVIRLSTKTLIVEALAAKK